jgi:uncharacterized protein
MGLLAEGNRSRLEDLMTRERLRTMPLEELAALARSAGLEPSEDLPAEELIELVLEGYEEMRQEREEGNNPSVRVEEAKFEMGDEEALGAGAEGPAIPQRYNETRAVLMVRDPHWAFAYWDVEDAQASRARRDTGFEQLVLRVQDLQPASSFDIPIQWSDSSWYIYLPNQDADYLLELGYLDSGKFRLLARSNPVHTPRESFSGEAPEEAESLFLGVVPVAFAAPSSAMSSEAIPQRILSSMRE